MHFQSSLALHRAYVHPNKSGYISITGLGYRAIWGV